MIQAATLRLCDHVFERLDWARLGEIYCDEGGDAFWAAHREPARRLGGDWARALARRLPTGGTSLYVGAGVAELVPMLVEACDLGRRVVGANLRAEEIEVLQAGLRACDLGARIDLRAGDAAAVAEGGRYDHLAVVSVLTDPETWPQLSGVTYGRIPAVALDVQAFTAERERARRLVGGLCAGLTLPGLVTTTVDEVAWFLDWSDQSGVSIEADDEVVETAIVGDPLGFLAVRSG